MIKNKNKIYTTYQDFINRPEKEKNYNGFSNKTNLKKYQKTLKNCKGCYNCNNCENCEDCLECELCKNSIKLSYCYACTNSQESSHISNEYKANNKITN